MARTICIVEPGNRIGSDLDSPGGRLERKALGVAPEFLEQHVLALRRRQLDEALGPELLEAGKRHAFAGRARSHPIINPLAPSQLVAIFGECLLVSEAARQHAEDIEIVAGLADRIDGAMHGEDEGIAR